jgi:hypothetical protein
MNYIYNFFGLNASTIDNNKYLKKIKAEEKKYREELENMVNQKNITNINQLNIYLNNDTFYNRKKDNFENHFKNVENIKVIDCDDFEIVKEEIIEYLKENYKPINGINYDYIIYDGITKYDLMKCSRTELKDIIYDKSNGIDLIKYFELRDSYDDFLKSVNGTEEEKDEILRLMCSAVDNPYYGYVSLNERDVNKEEFKENETIYKRNGPNGLNIYYFGHQYTLYPENKYMNGIYQLYPNIINEFNLRFYNTIKIKRNVNINELTQYVLNQIEKINYDNYLTILVEYLLHKKYIVVIKHFEYIT